MIDESYQKMLKERADVYLPFLYPLISLYPKPKTNILNICQGEYSWLKVITDAGFDANNAESSENLSETLLFLNKQNDQSFSAITVFNIIEKMETIHVEKLIKEAHRILKPGGILILESTTFESMLCNKSHRYTASSKYRLIPEQFLVRNVEKAGFARITVVKLQEEEVTFAHDSTNTLDYSNKLPTAYSLITQKSASKEILQVFDSAFDVEDSKNIEYIFLDFASSISELKLRIEQLDSELNEIRKSTSWKVTAPIRKIIKCKSDIVLHIENAYKGIKGYLAKIIHSDNKEIMKSLSLNSTDGNSDSLIDKKQKPKLFVDISQLVNVDSKTGIQRVVRNVIEQWLNFPPNNYDVELVYSSVGEYGYKYARRFREEFTNASNEHLEDGEIKYSQGDIFIGLDLQPQLVTSQREYFKELRENGVRVEFIVYDLLPVTMSECFPSGNYARFVDWLEVVAESDRAICISQSVAKEFHNWVNQHESKESNKCDVTWFHLGADSIDKSEAYTVFPDDSKLFLDSLRDHVSFLMVGTLEPRKGHLQTIEAFEYLWKKNVDITLTIVGKQGWLVDELANKIRLHPQLGERLFWLETITDEYLDRLYSSATCLIASSYGEGFGLPLIEAAQYNLPIIARDIAVFKEVAGEHAYYFNDSKDHEAIAECICKWLDLYSESKHTRSSNLVWKSWEESAEQLAQIVIND